MAAKHAIAGAVAGGAFGLTALPPRRAQAGSNRRRVEVRGTLVRCVDSMNAPPPTPVASPPTPPGKRAPSRAIALVANGVLGLMFLTSFGGCMKWGCQYDHLSDDASIGLAIVSAVVCLAATITATVVFVLNLRRKDESVATVTGLVLTTTLGAAVTVLSPIFWLLAGSGPMTGFGGWGRPLRIGKRALTPGVRASSEWANGPRPCVEGLDAETRAALRDLWLHDARKEHASVPAFGQVAWQLVALGAPADLVRRAHRSCLQEIDHAERCFALASAYGGEDLGVQEMPALYPGGAELPRDRQRALVKVAIEALTDGALLEDYNAELAATALADVRDPAAREALVRVVEDEREHARLAWDIIAFCVERGGNPVACALRKTFDSMQDEPVSLYDRDLERRVEALPDKSALYAHGRVRPDVIGPVFRERKAAAARRLEELLAPAFIDRRAA